MVATGDLYPFQVAGARWLAGQRTALLADPPGLGKTRQAIRAADSIAAKRILVLCPAIVRGVWLAEVEALQILPRVVRTNVCSGAENSPDVLIASYDAVRGPTVGWWAKEHFDLLILDEGHYLKNPRSLRTRAVYGVACTREGGIAAHARRTWVLTGTPVMNGLHELWTHYRALFPGIGRTVLGYEAWINTFCITRPTRFGVKVIGAKPEAVKRLREAFAPVMLRRRKEDVLPELPPMRMASLPLLLDDPDLLAALREIESEMGGFGVSDAFDNMPAKLYGPMGRLRQALGWAKAPLVARHIAERLDTDTGKAVVFVSHLRTLGYYEALLRRYGVVQISGATPARKRDELIRRFQEECSTRVFVGQIDACSTGITLHAASDCWLAEPSWNPQVNAQAAQRLHRIGQHDSVLAWLPFVRRTVDQELMDALRRKLRDTAAMLDAQEETFSPEALACCT